MEKRAFWMALVALMLSIGTIGVMIMSVWEMSLQLTPKENICYL